MNNNLLASTLISTIISYIISAYFNTKSRLTKLYESLRNAANSYKQYVIMQAYYVYSNRGILAVNGITVKRSGMIEYRTVILAPIYVIISFLIVAVLFPISMTQVTSAVTTSWSSAVSVSYVTLLPIIVIVAIILHYIGIF